jgi:parallel beta-helix repeat protein
MMTSESTNTLRVLIALAIVVVVTGAALSESFTVTNTDDSGAGSLRQAINNANANPGLDRIKFNIPGPGPHTIRPGFGVQPFPVPLPYITDPVIIDGYTQPDAVPATYSSPATLLIELDGTYADIDPLLNGLTIDCGGCTVRGLVINRFAYNGMQMRNGGGNIIEGNYIGTDVTGTEEFGYHHSGVSIWNSSGNRIGGTTPAARNIISGYDVGVDIHMTGATGNMVQGNYMGTDVTGTATLGSAIYGVHICENASHNTVGPGNVISGTNNTAIHISDNLGPDQAGNNLVQGNFIGTGASGTESLGNDWCGIGILGSYGNMLKDNVVSYGTIGIGIGEDPGFTAENNIVTGNTVSFNSGFGIQLEWANNNTIYNNNFINNHLGTPYQVVDHGGVGNVFYKPKPIGGNYWSDWTEPDINCDSFVDLPYLVWTVEGPSGEHGYDNQDNLPWACPNGWQTGCDCSVQPLSIELVKALGLPKGIENSLVSKLENAAKKLSEQNFGAAINSLNAFINAVEAQRGKKIRVADADTLIEAAMAIIDVIESL